MAQWGNTDDAANSVLWATAQVNLPANTTNQTALFGNTTANAFITNAIVGQFGAGVQEVQANGDITHSGWILRTEGAGGRTGRVTHEVLVAGGYTFTVDAADDAILPDYVLRIITQPSNTTANTSDSEDATFTVIGASKPAGATLAYAWTYANGDTIATDANVGVTTTDTLTVNSAVQTTNASFKVLVSTTGGANVTSANATLTITT
jgi:hypothetical protein